MKSSNKASHAEKMRDSRNRQPSHITKKESEKSMETMKATKKMFEGFDPTNVSTDVMKVMKSSFDLTFGTVTKVQELNERILKEAVQLGKEMQADALKMTEELIEKTKKGRNDYRKLVEEGFKKVEETL